MASERDLLQKLWNSLKSDRTVMLGLDDGDSQPMTAIFEDQDAQRNRVWIFTSTETDFARRLGDGGPATAHFAAKGHDVFATLQGTLQPDNARAVIDRLWSPFVAAWYKGGKDDPTLLLLRFDLDHAHVWLNENSVFAGVKLLLGSDPKKDAAGKTADVDLR